MKAEKFVEQGPDLIGKRVVTFPMGDYPGGVAKIISLEVDPEAPDIVMIVDLPGFGPMGILEYEEVIPAAAPTAKDLAIESALVDLSRPPEHEERMEYLRKRAAVIAVWNAGVKSVNDKIREAISKRVQECNEHEIGVDLLSALDTLSKRLKLNEMLLQRAWSVPDGELDAAIARLENALKPAPSFSPQDCVDDR